MMGHRELNKGPQSKHRLSLQDRLAACARETRDVAAKLPLGPERDALLKKAQQAEDASKIDWSRPAESE